MQENVENNYAASVQLSNMTDYFGQLSSSNWLSKGKSNGMYLSMCNATFQWQRGKT